MENDLNLPCIVTAYLDLSDFLKNKNSSSYLAYFSNLLELKNDIILFYDEKIEVELNELIKIKNKKNISLIKINMKFLIDNIYAWKLLDKAREVINSDYFNDLKTKRPCRGTTPEVNCAEYNLINYSKLDFINYVIDNNLSNHEYYSWVDFGLLREKSFIPEDLIYNPTECFSDDDALHIIADKDIESRWKPTIDWNFEFLYFWEKLAGGHIFSNKKNFKFIQQKFHEECEIMFSHKIIDDDQPILFILKNKFPNLIKIYRFEPFIGCFESLKIKKPIEGLKIF
jgi:hypothetical protein